MLVKVKDVIVKEGRISLNSKIVNELVESIKQIGLLNPILINSKNELVAGLHRLEAYKVLGYEDIEANTIDCLQQELAEIDENLIRNVLTAFVFDLQLARRKEIYESLYPETVKRTNVYIVQSNIGGPIKIGRSNSISSRTKMLQIGSPFKLSVIKEFKNVKVEFEKYLHEKFKQHRLHGEWFDPVILSDLDSFKYFDYLLG